MVCDVKQKVSGFNALIEMYLDNSLIATASTDNNLTFGGTWKYFELDKLKYSLVWSNHVLSSNMKKKLKDKIYVKFDITDANNEVIGSIYQKTTDGNIFKRYEYFEIDFYGTRYQLYLVPLGKLGHKYPIYKDDVQVSLIEKGNVVYNNMDEYQIYAKEFDTIEISMLLCLYLDLMVYGSLGVVVTKGFTKSYSLTTLKALKDKYDPLFKDSVI